MAKCIDCGVEVGFAAQLCPSCSDKRQEGATDTALKARQSADARSNRSPRIDLLMATVDHIDGHKASKDFGLVQGSSVRARNVGSDLGAGLKSIVGGELKGVTKLMEDAREDALQRMLYEAKSRGANAVVGLRFSTAQVWEGAAEVLAYGTAKLVEPIDE